MLLTVVVEDVPHTNGDRVEATSLGEGSAASYFHLPPNRVIELGAQIQL